MKYERVIDESVIEKLIDPDPFAKGTARHSYRLKGDPDVIVKKSIKPRHYSNILEWTIWLGCEGYPDMEAIVGRCLSLSTSGEYLIMERLDDISTDDYRAIGDVPAWFKDRKPSAFGKRNGQIKIRDYGMVQFTNLLNRSMVQPPAFAMNARTQAMIEASRKLGK